MTPPRLGRILTKIYYDPAHPAGYSSAQVLYDHVKTLRRNVSFQHIQDWLYHQDAYTLHRRIVKRHPRRKVLSRGIDYQWQTDLVILDQISKENSGVKHLLTAIDIFSRYAFVVPIKSKSSKTVVKAFNQIFKNSKRKCRKLSSDSGTEFLGRPFQDFCKKHKIIHFVTHQTVKQQIVERFHRSLKSTMWRYFTSHNTLRYLDVLPSLLVRYNTRKHRILGCAPYQVNKTNEAKIWEHLYGDYIRKKPKPFKFAINDTVRITKKKNIFEKGYVQSWTKEIFIISDRHHTNPVTYTLRDRNNTIIQGSFYEPEITKVIV